LAFVSFTRLAFLNNKVENHRRKSDASFGTTLDSDTFKAFRKGALTLLNNLHFQRSFTKLMPKAKVSKTEMSCERLLLENS